MTFAARTLGYLSQGFVVSPLPAMSVIDLPATGGANGSITFNPDGSISYVGGGSTGPALWFNPATTNIGTSYYIKFTLATGSPWVSGGLTSGTVYSLSSARSVGWVSPPRQGLSFSGTVTVQIYADAAGSSLLSTGTITENVVGN